MLVFAHPLLTELHFPEAVTDDLNGMNSATSREVLLPRWTTDCEEQE